MLLAFQRAVPESAWQGKAVVPYVRSWPVFCSPRGMDLFAFDPATTLGFLLTFMRVSLVMFLLPFFGGDAVPMQVKVALCLVMAMALWPRLSLAGAVMPSHPFELVVMLASELVLGLVLGMAVHFLFAGIQTGGAASGLPDGVHHDKHRRPPFRGADKHHLAFPLHGIAADLPCAGRAPLSAACLRRIVRAGARRGAGGQSRRRQ